MKKIFLFFAALLTAMMVNAGTAVGSDSIPTAAVLANNYDLSSNVVLCCYFDVAPCGDVVFAGSYKADATGAWITNPSELVHFEPVTGYYGWYAAAVPYTAGIQGKPVHLKQNGSFSWDYQVGDEYAWIHKGGNNAIIQKGFYGEANVTYPSAGAYIYEIAYWKNHVNPCENVATHKYTVYFFPPECEYVTPAIVGDFDNWQGVAMAQTSYNGAVAYKYTIEDEEGHGFKFFDLNLKWNNEIQYYDYSADIWVAKEQNFTLPKATKDTTLIFDFSNNSMFRWTQCNPTYTIVLFDPYCEANPEFAPQIQGEFSNGEFLAMERGTYLGKEAWILTVNAAPGSGYQIVEKHFGYGNQLQYYDAVSDLWWGLQTRLFPQEAEGTIVVLDYSDTNLYRYPLCGATDYDSTTIYDIHVTLKAPAGAPEKVEIVGDFSEKLWENGVLMSYNHGYYTATVKATANHQFKFREAHNSGTFLEYADGSAMENLVFGQYMDSYNRIYLDFSNPNRYKWTVWSEYVPSETYNLTVQADNSQNGSVSGGGEYEENETAIIMATPRKDCEFVRWEDGSTLNPRSVLVTSDAVYTAIFARNAPLPPVVEENTMYFTASDTVLTAKRVYSPSEIGAYDKLIIATVDGKNVMGGQSDTTVYTYRYNIEYAPYMNISEVSVVEVIPYGSSYRLKAENGYLAPRCTNCTAKPNQLYAEETGGADWEFVQYGNSVVPQAVAYAQRMILCNELASRFSSYRQVTGLDRLQTTVFKLEAQRIIPQEPEVLEEDVAASWVEEEPLEDIPVEITPEDTTAVISTPYVDFVASFTVIIWADEAHTQVLAVLTFDMNGQLLSAVFPNNIRRRAPRNNNNISFEIGNLLPNTTYYYSIMACEDDGSILKTVHESFTTTGAQALDQISNDRSPITDKLFRDGHLLILRGDKTYTLTGQEVK